MPPRDHTRYTREQLREAVANSANMAEVLRTLGLFVGGANYEQIRLLARRWGIDTSHLDEQIARRRLRPLSASDAELREAVASSRSLAEAMRRLGAEPRPHLYRQLRSAIQRLELDTSHIAQAWSKGQRRARRHPIEDYLVEGRPVATAWLRDRLIEEGLADGCCERCGLTRWQGEPIPLELDHINGDRHDNRRQNLQLLCPNCHALTPTYRGRNIGAVGARGRPQTSGEQWSAGDRP